MSRNRIIILLLIFAVLAVGALMFVRKKSATPPVAMSAKPSLTVVAETPDKRTWSQVLNATGNVQAWQEAVIGSEVAGLRLAELYANVGDTVKKGQVLASFTDEMMVLDLEQQRAAVDEARARFIQAEAQAESSQKLKDAGMVSTLSNIQMQSAAQIARAQMRAAEARKKSQKIRVGYTQVKAPDDGIISSRTATVGAVMQTGNELFRYIRRNRLEWRAEVPEATLQRIKPGQKVVLRGPEGEKVTGRVSRISPVVDVQSRNGSVYVELNGTKTLRAGMFAQGEFEMGRDTAMTVAQSALVMRDGFAYVFRLNEDSRVDQVKVTAGRRMEGRIEIVDGLAEDARVVITGAGFLSDGDLVLVSEESGHSAKKIPGKIN